MAFPEDFVWGAAAASYQIEGAVREDGRGPSVWDTFCERGRIDDRSSGEIACDHYHRYAQDTALMGELGMKGYRLSICWPRVLPEGTGTANEAGLDFYDRLIDSLLEHGVQPWVTLFHWDFPQALYDRGGWLSPDAPRWFGDYAALMAERLSDRVVHWMTLNEPQVFVTMGHVLGIHAPGDKLPFSEALQVSHHVNLAHGRAVQALRAHAKQPLRVGAAPASPIAIPASNAEADVQAARDQMFRTPRRTTWSNALFTDPWLRGEYPPDMLERFGADMPAIGASDLATIHQPLDFFGFNNYNGQVVRAGDDVPTTVHAHRGSARTGMDWPVTPGSLYWGPKLLHERYGLPVVVTENGVAMQDWVHLDGKVHDPARIDFLSRYLGQLSRAHDDGVPIEGYFQWCFTDNFEWSRGYRPRFGLVFMNYETQQRIIKDSGHWYAEVIRQNGRQISADPSAPERV